MHNIIFHSLSALFMPNLFLDKKRYSSLSWVMRTFTQTLYISHTKGDNWILLLLYVFKCNEFCVSPSPLYFIPCNDEKQKSISEKKIGNQNWNGKRTKRRKEKVGWIECHTNVNIYIDVLKAFPSKVLLLHSYTHYRYYPNSTTE